MVGKRPGGQHLHSLVGSESASAGLDGFPALLIKRGLIAASGLATAQSRVVRERIELADAVVALGVSESDSYAALRPPQVST